MLLNANNYSICFDATFVLWPVTLKGSYADGNGYLLSWLDYSSNNHTNCTNLLFRLS